MDINISQLKKIYNNTTVVDIASLNIAQGELIGLVGNNGAGKTTLMRLMLDLIKNDGGTVCYDQVDVSTHEQWKKHTGSFIDKSFLIDFYTPEEFFDFVAKVYQIDEQTMNERLKTYEPLMRDEILGKNKYIKDYSEGNRQKIGIIAAMMINPQLLILDEPFNYLDPTSQITIARLIQQLNTTYGTTVVLSSHNLNFVSEISTRILLLEKGIIIKDICNKDEAAIEELADYFREK